MNFKISNAIVRTTIGCLFICLFSQNLMAQPIPGKAQSEPIAVIGATIHTAAGTVIENGVLIFEDGVISVVADSRRNREWEKDRYKQIFATGKHIYPGLIAMNSQLGLVEIESLRASQDNSEVGSDNPNVSSLVAYNTDSRVIPTVRSNGILMAQICPDGGRWSGMSSLVQLDAWNWEDAVLYKDEGQILNWPRPYTVSGWWAEPGETNRNKGYTEQVRDLESELKQAKSYCEAGGEGVVNLRMRAFCPLFSGDRTLYIHADYAVAIQDAVRWALELGITPVIVGGRDSWQITDFLKEHKVSVILKGIHRLPGSPDEDIDQPYKTPALLKAAGILFAITENGYWQQRNLPFHAGHAVPFGLSREDALQAVTVNPARIMGLDDRIGSLQTGLDATFIICRGDILDMRSSEVEQAFIQGREIDLDNHHKQLYRRFEGKYQQN